MEIICDLNELTQGSFSFDEVRNLTEDKHKEAFICIFESFFSKIEFHNVILESKCLIEGFGSPYDENISFLKKRYFYHSNEQECWRDRKKLANSIYMSDSNEIFIKTKTHVFTVCADPCYIGVKKK